LGKTRERKRVALIPRDEVGGEWIMFMNLTEKVDKEKIEREAVLMENENRDDVQSRERVRKVPTRALEKKKRE